VRSSSTVTTSTTADSSPGMMWSAIADVSARRHIADRLSLPAHVLGVSSAGDAEFAAMLQFGDATTLVGMILGYEGGQ